MKNEVLGIAMGLATAIMVLGIGLALAGSCKGAA